MGTEEREQEAFLDLCMPRQLPSCLMQRLSDTCSTRERAARYAIFGIVGSSLLPSWSGSVSEDELEWKRRQTKESQMRLLRQLSEGGEYYLSRGKTCKNLE